MSKRYPGGVIRKTPATPTQSSASGVWNMTDVTQAQQTNNWPVANVPNPMSRSLRFRSSASAYLNRTPTVAGNRKTWTWSGWVKRGSLSGSTDFALFSAYGSNDDSGFWNLRFRMDANTNCIAIGIWNNDQRNTTAVYRDPSSWYHIVVAVDTTQATATNRTKLYVNGVQVTAFSTENNVAQNTDLAVNNTVSHKIGADYTGRFYLDGYLSEVNFIDGQALAPTAFGQYDQFSNWTSKKYTGTYGTNGFYLPFSNNSSTGTLGLDFSGNNNTWTTNNISVTAGTTYDSMVDVPTQWTPYNVTGDVGGVIRGNYAVLNPLWKDSGVTISNGNLNVTGGNYGGVSTLLAPTGYKFYAEYTVTATEGNQYVGITKATAIGGPLSYFDINSSYGCGYYSANGNKSVFGVTNTSYGASWGTIGDVISVALDLVNNTVTFYKNGSSQGAISITASMDYFFTVSNATSSGGVSANFGQRPFTYAPPSGYKSLCTTNLPTPTIGQGNLVMDATLYTGTGASLTVANAGSFKPDAVWLKNRSGTENHQIFDSVRGANNALYPNLTNGAGTDPGLTAFNSNGFTVNGTNDTNGASYVGWQWQAGQGTSSSNTSGTITSTVSVNAAAGFSVVTYTGNGTSGATVGHGLGVAPSMIITKVRSTTSDWYVWQTAMGDNFMRLNTTAAQVASTGNGVYNTASFSSTVFALGNGAINGSGQTLVSYCWSEVAGFSKFGSYTGNGSTDGPFIYCGFRPKFVMFKFSTNPGEWIMQDTSRQTYNNAPNNAYNLSADSSCEENNAAVVGGPTNANNIDFLSNGFKIRYNNGNMNTNTGTYIFMAFAEYPFKSALAR